MILVTGATGLVGTHLLYRLTQDGNLVRALYRSEKKRNHIKSVFGFFTSEVDILWSKIEWLQGDINDVGFLHEAFKNVTQVYHCAALISFSPEDEAALLKINVEGTANIVNASLESGVNKLVHISSVAALGSFKEGIPVNENNEWKEGEENSMYATSKYLGELEVWRGMEEGLNAVIVNPVVIFGECDWNTSSGVLFKSAFKGLKFYPPGSFGFVDAQDVADVAIKLMESHLKGEKYILHGANRTYKEFLSAMANCFNKPVPSVGVNKLILDLGWRFAFIISKIKGRPPGLTKDTARSAMQTIKFDSSKIQKDISFSFRPFEESMKRICGNFMKQV